jgi:hypothetical protein
MKRRKSISDQPNVDIALFWDWDYEKMDFHKAYSAVIARIIERGTKKEWEEMIRFYGKEKIIKAIKRDISYLPDYIIPKTSTYFNIPEKEMRCFAQKQSRKTYWI